MNRFRLDSRAILVGLLAAVVGAGCASTPDEPEALLVPTEEQMQLRNMQTREFDISDRRTAIRAVIATLQDFGFIIERANEPLGVVTAARFAEPDYYSVMGVTVTVREVSDEVISIRANAIFNNQPVTDAETYRNFFAALERALFIDRST